MLIRSTTDAAIAVSPRLRAWIAGDPRKFYNVLAVVFIIAIGIVHLALPTQLLQISANMANIAALIFPIILIYLNSKLPEAGARSLVGPRHSGPRVSVLRLLLFQFPDDVSHRASAGKLRACGGGRWPFSASSTFTLNAWPSFR